MAVSIDWLIGSVVDGSGGTSHSGGEDGGVGHGVVGDVGVGVVPEIGGGSGQDGGQTDESL